jgi:hypothetical protein
MPHSSPVNFFITENTYIAFSCFGALKASLWYEEFQHGCSSSSG